MKRVGVILLLLLLVCGGWFLLMPANHTAHVLTGGQPLTNMPPLAARKQMSHRERLQWLEQNGEVPADAQYGDKDWVLAQRTTWWGKPLDAKAFWKNRVIWLDSTADMDARRHGRGYPPPPYEDELLTKYPSEYRINLNSFELEGPNIHFAISSKEKVFWDRFDKTMPKPPEKLVLQQADDAESVMVDRYYFQKGGNPTRDTAESLVATEAHTRKMAVELGFPSEAFTEDALYWAYIHKCRQDFKITSHLPTTLAVDTKLITDPLTPEQIKAANAWKTTYLQRLRREKVDEQYIQAYLKAWNLSAAEVFGEAH